MDGKIAWIVIVAIAAGCQSAAHDPAAPRARQETYVAKADADGVQRARVMAGSYFFQPGHIVVRANMPVELMASREAGMVPHDLVIEGLDLRQELSTEPARIAFTPGRAGKYAIYCSKKPPFGGATHRERGMEAVLEVVP